MQFEYELLVTYSNGDKTHVLNEGNEQLRVGDLYVGDSKQTVDSTGSTTYTIPINAEPHGKAFVIARQDQQGAGREEFIDYQTCDTYALFGVPTDSSICTIDYGTAISSLSFAGNGYVMDAGVLAFRPIKSCTINFDTPSGWYIEDTTMNNLQDFHFNLGAKNPSLTQLPTEETGLSGVYTTAGFKPLPSSLTLQPNSIVVIGTYGTTNFYFAKNFSVSTSSIVLGNAATSSSFTITTDPDTNWTVTKDSSSWITLGTTSGTGSGTVTFNVSTYTGSGSNYRIGYIYVEDDEGNRLTVSVQQNPATAYVTFGDVSGDITVNYDSGNSAIISEGKEPYVTGESDVFLTIPFRTNRQTTITAVPAITGTYQNSCDIYYAGFAVSNQSAVYDTANALPICNNTETLVKTLSANTDYYLQIWRGADTETDPKDGAYLVSIEITFS